MSNQNKIFIAIALSESMHVFCCVLPSILSIISLMAGLGLVGAIPVAYTEFHDAFHDWELPIIAVSGALLLLGWGLYLYSRKIDCHDTGCEHEPCEPKKDRSKLILVIASALFVLNLCIYAGIHQDVFGIFEDLDHGHAHDAHEH